MSLTGVAALEEWCRRCLLGTGIQLNNMTTSWRDGMAFCALIHRYRPDIIKLDQLDPDQPRANCELAFQLAEQELGIPALLDAEDLVDTHSPDRLSILTYLSEFYHRLEGCSGGSYVASGGYDSGVASSIGSSPMSSDSEGEMGRTRRSLSRHRQQRGAIHSLMDGRRVRSLSCSGGGRRRAKSEDLLADSCWYYAVPPDSPPIQRENPFISRCFGEIDDGLAFDPDEFRPVAVQSVTVVANNIPAGEKMQVKRVTLRERKNKSGRNATTTNSQRMTKSLVLDSEWTLSQLRLASTSADKTEINRSDILGNSDLPKQGCSDGFHSKRGLSKSGSLLSFTPIPVPYQPRRSRRPLGMEKDGEGSERSLLISRANSRGRLPFVRPSGAMDTTDAANKLKSTSMSYVAITAIEPPSQPEIVPSFAGIPDKKSVDLSAVCKATGVGQHRSSGGGRTAPTKPARTFQYDHWQSWSQVKWDNYVREYKLKSQDKSNTISDKNNADNNKVNANIRGHNSLKNNSDKESFKNDFNRLNMGLLKVKKQHDRSSAAQNNVSNPAFEVKTPNQFSRFTRKIFNSNSFCKKAQKTNNVTLPFLQTLV